MKLIFIMILTFILSSVASAADINTLAEKVKKGNEFYKQENYKAAQKEYTAAQIDSPENSDINYNQANVFYKQKKYDKAIAAYKKALEMPTKKIEMKCYYNIGDCLVQQGKLKEALTSYKQALRLDRDDEDIKYNIEYVQLKLKEIEKKKKKDKKKKDDPLNKLLKELEKLIGVQAQNNVQTKKLNEVFSLGITNQQDFTNFLINIQTNEHNYAFKTFEIREGFKDLRTNLPPEKLYGKQSPQGMANSQLKQRQPVQKQLSLDQSTRDLINIYKLLAESASILSSSNATSASTINKLSEIENELKQVNNTTKVNVNKQFSASGKDIIKRIKYMLMSPQKTDQSKFKKISEEFNSLMGNIQSKLNSQVQQGNMLPGMANGNQKTLAQKIDNAVKYLATARDSLGEAADFLKNDWTNAPPEQKIGLEYLIRARKEFDDKNQKNQNKNNKQNNKQKNKKKKDKKKDKKDDKNKNKDKKKDKKKDKQKQDKNKDKNKQKQKNKQNKKQEKQPKLDKKQVNQMLKNFKEDQRNKRKMRMQKAHAAGYIPVDKDW